MTNPLAQDLGGVVLLPCPWCGEELTAVRVSEGSTFRWRKVDGCCTDGPEVRHDTMADDQAAAEIDSTSRAIAAWNTRTNSAEIAGALRDAERWRVWRELGEHEAADIAWLNAGEERDAALDAMQQGGGGWEAVA